MFCHSPFVSSLQNNDGGKNYGVGMVFAAGDTETGDWDAITHDDIVLMLKELGHCPWFYCRGWQLERIKVGQVLAEMPMMKF